MINGSFAVVRINRKCLFLNRKDDGLFDLAGGGYDPKEVDYREVIRRELKEETGLEAQKDQFELIGVLGQRLKKEIAEKHGVQYGYVFLHTLNLYGDDYRITLSDEHVGYSFLTYDEILKDHTRFKSGPLWMFFTFLTYQDTGRLQEGMLFDRRWWQGKEYV